jgi:hypothetical protein
MIERQKIGYLKTMFQRSKVIVSEIGGKIWKSQDADARKSGGDPRNLVQLFVEV